MRIIDDVLTLSKLDSMVLSVVPVDVQIHECVSQAINIFQSELQVKGISSKYLVRICHFIFVLSSVQDEGTWALILVIWLNQLEDSYTELGVDWIKADPCRFSQILVGTFFAPLLALTRFS